MAMESNSYGVLAKLMGVDRLSSPNITYQRQRVLSESYFQNIASVVHRERSSSDSYENEFSMSVDTLLENQDSVERSEGSNNDYVSPNSNGLNSRNKLGETFRSQSYRSELFDGFELQGSSHTFSGKERELSDAQVLRKSHQHIKTGSSRRNILRHSVKEENDYCLSAKSVSKLNKPGGKSSFSSLSPLSGGKEQNVASFRKHKGINFQSKKMKSLENDMESSRQGSVFRHKIAKQITSEVKHSVWHSYRDVSRSGSISDNSSLSEHEKIMPLSSSLSELEDKEHEPNEATPFRGTVTTLNIETQNMKKQISEKWRTKKFSHESRISQEISDRAVSNVSDRNGVYHNTLLKLGNGNGLWVVSARYLSKPMLFPSAWVPGSRSKQFTLDKNWTFKKVFYPQKASSTPQSSGFLEEQNVCEEFFTAQESLSDGSDFQDVESSTYNEEVPTFLNGNGDASLEGTAPPVSSDSSLAPLNVNSEQVTNEANEKTVSSIEIHEEILSAELAKCTLVEKKRSDFQDFDKQELKDNAAFEPWSPVSSLEGPEAYSQHAEEVSSVPECFVSDLHGLQAKLQLIEAASLESGSEGPGMMVSSDEGDEAGSVCCYREDAQIMEIPGLSLNRDFSYLADVLAKSGFLLSNSELDSETYCSLGYVLNSSLFMSLEEKYGKHSLWERSDRKLLFDRINFGLIEIAQPLVGINMWKKPVSKRFVSFIRGQKTIEEQLWAELVNQEEKFKKKSSDKLCRREIEWLELEEDIGLLVQEIEFLFIDELIQEFVIEVFGEM